MSQNMFEALSFLHKSFAHLTASQETFVWQAARDEFVENFTRLVQRSQMQVGHHTSKTFAEVDAFLKNLVDKDSTYQQNVYRSAPEEEEEEEYEEVPQKQPSPVKGKSPVKQEKYEEEEEDEQYEGENEEEQPEEQETYPE